VGSYSTIPSAAELMHFGAFLFLASERYGLVIESLNISERPLCFSDSSPATLVTLLA
jgi:hypothetical protein